MSKIFIKTFGCAYNQADSEIMKNLLVKNNFQITNSYQDSDLVIINSCNVKNLSEAKFFAKIKKCQNDNKKIITCGCVVQSQKDYLKTKLKNISCIGIYQIDKICDVVKKTLDNQIIHKIEDLKINFSLDYRQKQESIRLNTNFYQKKLIEIIPINQGCLGICSYCKTKQARGNLLSYSIKNIVNQVNLAILNGSNQIYLTSQDIATYGSDINTNLINLLEEILKIKKDFKIRLGMGNPNHFNKIIDKILDIMQKDSRIYKFLHIPIQSGNDRILKEMQRGYTKQDYINLVKKIRKKIPKITLANDIIVAYPTETQEEFEQSLEILKKTKTNVLNYSRFWLRKNTLAQKKYSQKDLILGTCSKNRSKKIREYFEKQAKKNNLEWKNWQGTVYILEKGKENTNTLIGRNNYYKPIILKNTNNLKIGDKVKVKITKCTSFEFFGEVLEKII